MKTNKKFNPPCYEAGEYYALLSSASSHLERALETAIKVHTPNKVLDDIRAAIEMGKDLCDYILENISNGTIEPGDFLQLTVRNPF